MARGIADSIGNLCLRLLPTNLYSNSVRPAEKYAALRGDLVAIFQPLAWEIETRTITLNLALNDAQTEHEANRHEMAWYKILQARHEWEDLTKLLLGLLRGLDEYLPTSTGIVVNCRVAVPCYRCRTILDFVALYDFLDNLLLTPESRLSVHMHFLSRASTELTKQLRLTCLEGEINLDSSPERWSRFDDYFHDLDLIAKDILLVFRTLLVCQSPERAQELASALQVHLERARRVFVSPVAPMKRR